MRTVADLILDLLAEKPRTGFEVTRALEDEHRILLRGREGVVYAALMELERAGMITSEVATRRGERERRVYDLPVLEDVSPKEGAK
jgi:DNA-binding PadR family transcriptional regulator